MTEHDTFLDALSECVRALGGPKAVGVRLRPEYEDDPPAAARWLNTCLNPDRAERLSIEQVLTVMRDAKKAGCHAGMYFVADSAGYARPQPISAEDQRLAVMRDFTDAVAALQQAAGALQRMGINIQPEGEVNP